ncbi:Nucleoside 2-deoxyribosyltransferase [Granulicatella balaenopterae]|uniref:Nucleoside 2-deoxyribosyltransferase n=1 Tax=Granulicatella balaenopterae TaxID=137733 RepID=A0A1H9HSW3_9LACT|nr:nucleoside 2-deoxyribosyltransferase [Granulicatella balaenopterae]SEQ65395.1 Nucleoside 2-deoxyribosyltransferase [Granulicatella balaenopterae]
MKKVYFASPLFSEMELAFNAMLVTKIRQAYPNLDIYVPQEQMEINDKNAYADSTMIAQYDTKALLESQLMIAVLDGVTIDAGVASEIGIAYQAGIPILGLFSDSRQKGADNPQKLDALQEVCESQFPYVNLYTAGLIKLRGEIVSSSDELLEALKGYSAEKNK